MHKSFPGMTAVRRAAGLSRAPARWTASRHSATGNGTLPVRNETRQGYAIEVLQKQLGTLTQRNLQPATRQERASAMLCELQALDDTQVVLDIADNLTNTYLIRRLRKLQSAVAPTQGNHMAFAHQRLRNLGKVIA